MQVTAYSVGINLFILLYAVVALLLLSPLMFILQYTIDVIL